MYLLLQSKPVLKGENERFAAVGSFVSRRGSTARSERMALHKYWLCCVGGRSYDFGMFPNKAASFKGWRGLDSWPLSLTLA